MGENRGKWEKIRKLGWCLLLHSTIGGGIIPYQGLIVAGVPNINNKA